MKLNKLMVQCLEVAVIILIVCPVTVSLKIIKPAVEPIILGIGIGFWYGCLK